MSKATTITLKPFQQKSYLVPKIKAKPDEQQHTGRSIPESPVTVTVEVPPLLQQVSAPLIKSSAAPAARKPGKRKAEIENPEDINDGQTHGGPAEKAPCAAPASRSTRSKSAEPQQETIAASSDAGPPHGQSPAVGHKRSRPAPLAAPPAADQGPARPSAVEDVDLSTFADGNEIFRYMKQLGSTVDDVLGDDDDKPAGRRGSKEKKCTPLKEKLHKSWGGRGYMERLDIVMAQSGPPQQQGPAQEEDVFKPMFLRGPAVASSEAEGSKGGSKAVAASPAMAEIPPIQPKASPSRRSNAGRQPTQNQAPAPAPQSNAQPVPQPAGGKGGKSSRSALAPIQASNQNADVGGQDVPSRGDAANPSTKKLIHKENASQDKDAKHLKHKESASQGKGSSGGSMKQSKHSASQAAPAAVTPILPSVTAPGKKTNRLVGPKPEEAPRAASSSLPEGPSGGVHMGGVKTSPLPAGAVVWGKGKIPDESVSAAPPGGTGRERGRPHGTSSALQKGTADSSGAAQLMAPPPNPAARSAGATTSSRPAKLESSSGKHQGDTGLAAPGGKKRGVVLDTPTSSSMHLGKVVGASQAMTRPSPSPMTLTLASGGAKQPREGVSVAAEDSSETRAKIARLEGMVARLQKQESKKAAESEELQAEKKDLQAQVTQMARRQDAQEEELATARGKSLRQEQEIKDLKLQASESKAKDKLIKEVSSKLDRCKKMMEAAVSQLASLVSSE